MPVTLAGPAFDAVAHLLALVPVPASAPLVTRAASLWDPRYAAWTARLPPACTAPAAADAPLLGALLARAPAGERLQALLVLHPSVDELARAAAHPLREAASAGAPWARTALEGLAAEAEALVEVARCAAALLARPYAEAWRALEPELAAGARAVGAALEAAGLAALTETPVRLSHPLGPRGRGLGDAVVVGAPGGWSELSALDVAARAAHEVAVLRAAAHGANGWGEAEALALAAAARAARGTPLEEAHAAFVQGLDRTGLPLPGPGVEALARELRGA